jgi:hypothetical protein
LFAWSRLCQKCYLDDVEWPQEEGHGNQEMQYVPF